MAHVGQEAAFRQVGGIGGLAGANQFRFVSLALGDIFRNSGDANHLPGMAANGKSPIANPSLLSAGRSYAVFRFDRRSAHLPLEQRVGLGAVFGVDGLQPVHRVLVDTFAGPAPNLFIGGADIEELGGRRVHHPEDFANVFGQLAKLLFAAAKRVRRLLMLGDIRAKADVAQEPAGRRESRLGVRKDPAPLPVGTPDARLRTERRMLLDRALDRRQVRRRIVRMNQRKPLGSLHLFVSGAEKLPVCAVDKPNFTLGVGHPHRSRATVRHDPEALFTLAQRFFRSLALRHIFDVEHKIQRAAGAVPDNRDPGSRPHDVSGPVKVSFFHLHAGRRIAEQPLDRPPRARAVLGVGHFQPARGQEFLCGVSEHPAKGRIHLEEAPVGTTQAHP